MSGRINSYSELQFYIQADRIMNGYPPCTPLMARLASLLSCSWGGLKLSYLESMRKYSYYKNCEGMKNRILRMWYGRRFRKLGLRLGYSIGEDVFGYGLVIPHYGTIVVGGTNSVGNYATIHTLTCIADGHSIIGDSFDFATGSIISKHVIIGDSVSTCANSTITTDVPSHSLVAGSPAKVVRTNYPTWFERDGDYWQSRVQQCERIRI